MADPTEDLVIEIPSDAVAIAGAVDPDGLPKVVAEEVVDEPAPKPKAKEPEPKPDLELQRQLAEANQRIADMAKNLEAKDADLATANVERDKSNETSWRTHWAKVNADLASLKSTLSSTDSEIAHVERELTAATTDNDAARIAASTRSIARLEAHKARLEDGVAGAEAEKEDTKVRYLAWVDAQKAKPEPKVEAKEPEKKPQAEVLTPDEWIETKAPRATRSWFREHPEFVKPGTKQQRQLDVFVAKYLLDNDRDQHDIAYLNSSAFVQALDKEFFPSEDVNMAEDDAPKRGAREEEPEAKPAPKPRVATPAAPVSRSGSYFSSSNMTAKQVRLPPKLAKFVKDSGLDPTQYALGAVEDIKAGKLPKNFLDPDYDHQF